MMPGAALGVEFFDRLREIDELIAARVATARCPHCKGPLHWANYQRKPRWGRIAEELGADLKIRHSLCCGTRGCRRRSLPPSLRFLGRRVYLEAVVILASVFVQVVATARAAASPTGIPARTLVRWGTWWREAFPASALWVELRARFVPPPPDESRLPQSLMLRLNDIVCEGGRDPTDGEVLLLAARCLAPATTCSVSDGSRFVRAVMAHPA
jgi:hypothetical protein